MTNEDVLRDEISQQLGAIDPLHPLIIGFEGSVAELKKRVRDQATIIGMYRQLCTAVPEPSIGDTGDPGPSMYLYCFFAGDMRKHRIEPCEVVYVGITRNLATRLQGHRSKQWWKRVTHAYIARIDCRYHNGICTRRELDNVARAYETWHIEALEPTENLSL